MGQAREAAHCTLTQSPHSHHRGRQRRLDSGELLSARAQAGLNTPGVCAADSLETSSLQFARIRNRAVTQLALHLISPDRASTTHTRGELHVPGLSPQISPTSHCISITNGVYIASPRGKAACGLAVLKPFHVAVIAASSPLHGQFRRLEQFSRYFPGQSKREPECSSAAPQAYP